MICSNGKITTHQMPQYFSNLLISNQYLRYLEEFITLSSNDTIIERCYHKLPSYHQILFHNYDIVDEDFWHGLNIISTFTIGGFSDKIIIIERENLNVRNF